MKVYFRITSYALVAVAFLALALTGQLDAISMVLYAGAIGLSFVRDSRVKAADEQPVTVAPSPKWRVWAGRGAVALYIPFMFLDALVLTNRVLALVHIALFASALKLLQPKRDRDWVFLYIIAFFEMLLSAGLTFNATFVGSLVMFLFCFISTLAAFEIRRAQREATTTQNEVIAPIVQVRRSAKENAPAASPHRLRYLMGASFVQMAIIALLTLPFFFMIPRFSGGGVAQGFSDSTATGFSESVELGQVARIKRSQAVVMRVQLDRNPGRYLRWRGVALENYDGHEWTLAKELKNRHKYYDQGRMPTGSAMPADSPMEWQYSFQEAGKSSATPVGQTVILEPIDTPTIFAAQKVVKLRAPVSNLSRDLFTDALAAGGSFKRRTTYTVWSDVSVPGDQELRADPMTGLPEHDVDLQLPPGKLDLRIPQLAHEIVREAGAVTAFDKAKAIETYLKTRFGYTLNLTIQSEDPLSEFLFDVREGHCEYFATAMVILLRTLRIPARIVNGFQMGEYNDVNGMFTVRESDAHSWVEVYFPHTGSWVEFDPTPAAGINDYSQGGLIARFRKYMDAMEVFWLDYIVTLDSDEQASLVSSLQQRLAAFKDRLMFYYNGAKDWTRDTMNFVVAHNWRAIDWVKLASILVALLALGGTVYVLRHLKQWSLAPTGYGPWWHRWFILPTWKRRRLARRDGRECAVMFYEQMLAIASRGGLVKQTHQTPKEFADLSDSESIHEITLLYNRVRFGGAALDEAETRRVSRLLVELRRHLRKSKPARTK
jgi:protein-glutamine gamma-glutamyltransferase